MTSVKPVESTTVTQIPSPSLGQPENRAITTEATNPNIRNQLELEHRPEHKTFADIEAEQKKTFQYMLMDIRKVIHLVTSSICAVTAVASGLLSETNNTRVFLEKTSTGLAKLAIGVISGISGAVDAFKDGKHLLAWSQIGDAITTVMAPTEEITNYRGLWVGAYNALPALETIEGKSQYESFGDNVKTTWKAFKRALTEMKKNPTVILDPSKSGMLGVLTGTLTTTSTLLYMLTGSKFFASLRDMLGMGVETEKLKSTHFEAGRGRYIASGITMLLGSAANMTSKFTERGKSFWSYLNLSANAIGKLFYLDALQANEPARHQDPITLKEIFTNTIRESLDWGRQTRESVQRAQPKVIQAPEIEERIEELKEESREKLTAVSEARRVGSTRRAKPSRVVATSPKGTTASSPKETTAAKPTPKTPAQQPKNQVNLTKRPALKRSSETSGRTSPILL